MTTELRPDEDLIDVRVEHKTPVGDARAVKGRPGRIGTVDNAISVMGISFAHRIFPLRRRIFFGGVLWTDLRCDIAAPLAFLSHFICVELIVGLRFIILITTAASFHLSPGRVR